VRQSGTAGEWASVVQRMSGPAVVSPAVQRKGERSWGGMVSKRAN
jgi:hypothetical protein